MSHAERPKEPDLIGCIPEHPMMPVKMEPYEGSIRITCPVCQKGCFLGPKQQEHVSKHPDASVLCLDCVVLAEIANRQAAGERGSSHESSFHIRALSDKTTTIHPI